jgi:acetyl/propionyl-CoA carboxylase alpha subunit
MPDRRFVVSSSENEWRVTSDGAHVTTDDGLTFEIAWTAGEGIVTRSDADGIRDRVWAAADRDTRWVFRDGVTYELTVEAEDASRVAARRPQGGPTAPMPATVIAVNVKPGDSVQAGDILLVLEAMKMELPVRAAADGTVTAVHCQAGELVQPGVSLVDLS